VLEVTMIVGRKKERVLGGPFPCTPAQLTAARDAYRTMLAADPHPLGAPTQAVQTIARELLREHCPDLKEWDCICLGIAVTCSSVLYEETQ
jgi:hypothetical protein